MRFRCHSVPSAFHPSHTFLCSSHVQPCGLGRTGPRIQGAELSRGGALGATPASAPFMIQGAGGGSHK